jgi:hypothetical protein
MSTTKLTLTVEPKTIKKAKEYARTHKTSVSSFFSRLVDSLIDSDDNSELLVPRGSELSKVAGIIKADKTKSYDELRYDSLADKYDLSELK